MPAIRFLGFAKMLQWSWSSEILSAEKGEKYVGFERLRPGDFAPERGKPRSKTEVRGGGGGTGGEAEFGECRVWDTAPVPGKPKRMPSAQPQPQPRLAFALTAFIRSISIGSEHMNEEKLKQPEQELPTCPAALDLHTVDLTGDVDDEDPERDRTRVSVARGSATGASSH